MQRQLLIWTLAALAGVIILVVVLLLHHEDAQDRWTTFMVGDPQAGAHLFFEEKGCAGCHAANGVGGRRAPDLSAVETSQAGVAQLVSAMWNCGPRMWELMGEEGMSYPELSQEEIANLFAFLYTARYTNGTGDASRGRELFTSKECVQCHADDAGEGTDIAPALTAMAGMNTPIRWTQEMWNHASTMAAAMEEMNVDWPRFDGSEMNDLLAYIRSVSQGASPETELFPASPENGWEVFQNKSCIVCHSVGGTGGEIGPDLGPGRRIPLTIVQFAGLMWNHAPEMTKELASRGIPQPTFEGEEIADMVAFLGSLRYFEPEGSPLIGASLFTKLGCSYCHGQDGEGTDQGPALRWSNRNYNSIMLATALWSHGPMMHRRTEDLEVPWPTLTESDVGNLVSYLNTASYRSR